MAATSPSRGGNRREWPGSTAGGWAKVANCQAWDVPGLFSARWDGHWWTRGCICPELDLGPRCEAAGVPEDRRNYRSKTELALEMVERVTGVGPPQGRDGLRRTTPSGCRRPSGRAWRPWGCTCWTFRPALRCGPGPGLDQSGVSGIRASSQTQAASRSAPDHGAAQR